MRIEMNNQIPLARGLGSSAAAAWPGCSRPRRWPAKSSPRAVCLRWRPRSRTTPTTPPPPCSAVSSSSAATRRRAARFDPPESLFAALFIPDVALRTAEMREALPATVTHADATHNVGRTAMIVAALASGAARPALRHERRPAARAVPGRPFPAAARARFPRHATPGAGRRTLRRRLHRHRAGRRRGIGKARGRRHGRDRAQAGSRRAAPRSSRPVSERRALIQEHERELPAPAGALQRRRLHPARVREWLDAGYGRSGRRRRRLPDSRSGPSGPRVDDAAQDRPAAVGRLHATLLAAQARLAPGRRSWPWPCATRPKSRPASRTGRSGSSGPTTSSPRAATAACARSPACWANRS